MRPFPLTSVLVISSNVPQNFRTKNYVSHFYVYVTSLAHRTVSEGLITLPLVNKEVLYCTISTHKLFVCCTVCHVMFARCVLSFTQTPCDSCRVGETVERFVVWACYFVKRFQECHLSYVEDNLHILLLRDIMPSPTVR